MRTDYQEAALQAAGRKRAGMAAGAALAGCLLLWMGPSTAGLISKHLGRAPAPVAAQVLPSLTHPTDKKGAGSQPTPTQVRTGTAGSLPASATQRSLPMSLLDEVGKLAIHVSPAEAAGWKDELHATHDKVRAAQLHLWIGEWELAQNEQPGVGEWHFAVAQGLTGPKDRLYGRAAYDTALTLYFQGRYAEALPAFQKLLSPKSWLLGYDIRTCAFWTREAEMCAQYHAKRTRMGIPEPTHLDPLCAAEALAACLQHLQLPFDKATVLRACRVTGEGSNLQDVMNAGKKLGVVVRPVTANDEGLMALPKPVVCHVEHDHFIAVTAADKTGVTYLCSDCGCWPGGKIHLSWKQWHMLNADGYGTVTKRGTSTDRWLSDVLSGRRPRILLAQAGGGVPVGPVSPPGRHAIIRIMLIYPGWMPCTYKPSGVEFCLACWLARDFPHSFCHGPAKFDPVNLATGEEEYADEPDLVVYNPHGPSVSWSRIYDSYRSWTYDNGFSLGWSHSYNIGIAMYGSNTGQVVMPNGGMFSFILPAAPSASQPRRICPVEPGIPALVEWDYNAQNPGGTFIVTFKDRTRWFVPAQTSQYGNLVVTQIMDRNGNVIHLNYGSNFNYGSNALLSTITDGSGNALLTIGRDSSGLISQVSDCYGRIVVYGFSPVNGSWNGGGNITQLQSVSQVAAYGTPNPPARATFTYNVLWAPGEEGVPFLHTISVPSPKNDGTTSTATINTSTSGYYSSTAMPYASVSSLQDANGNTRTYSMLAGGGTGVTVRNAIGDSVNTFSKGYDNHADETDHQNGEGTEASTQEYADGNAPHEPSRITDGIHSGADSQAQQGTSQSFQAVGSDSPAPRQWDITLIGQINGQMNGQIVVSSSVNPGGWTVSAAAGAGYPGGGPGPYSFTVTAPAGATISSTYQVRYVTGTQNQANISADFEVIAPGGTGTSNKPNVQQGQSSTFGTNGSYAPATPQWDIVRFNGGTPSILATSDSPGGWTVEQNTSGGFNRLTVGIPAGAATGGYEVRFSNPYQGYNAYTLSASFTVTDPHTFAAGVTNLTWTAQGNPKTVTDPRGVTTTYTYYQPDPYTPEELIQVKVDGKAPTRITYYEPSGLPATITTPRPGTTNSTAMVTTAYLYDTLGNVTSITRPGNNSASVMRTTFNYTSDPMLTGDPNYVAGGTYTRTEALGEPLSVTDNLGHTTHFRYDVRDNRTVSVDALGNRADAAFNLADQNLTAAAPPTGQTGNGRSYSQNNYQYPGGSLTSTVLYDESGNLSRQVNFHYGPEGELVSKTGSTEPASYDYDAEYRLLRLRDGNNNETSYQYSATTGYLTQVQYPGGQTTQFTQHDANGDLLQRVDGNGAITNYVYSDPESQVTDIQYVQSAGLNVHVTYDQYGRRASMSDGAGYHSYGYDDLNLPVSVSTTYTNNGTSLPTQTVGYAYYRDGSRKSMTTPAGMFYYGYDAGGRASALVNPCGYTSGWSYQDNNRLQQQSLGNGVTANYQYNGRGLLTDLQNLNPSQTLLSEYGGQNGMQYDAAGNRTSLTANVPGVAAATGTTTYGYGQQDTNDPQHATTTYAQDELTGESSTRGSGYSHSFGYDAAFNPVSSRGVTQVFNANNQNTANSYDNNGNPVEYASNQVSWDPENRMTAFGTLLTAGYTGDGLRAWKQAPGSPKTWFIYDGSIPVMEINTQGQVTAVNTFGAAGLLSRTSYNSGTPVGNVFYTFDAQGSVSQRSDKNGAVLSSSAYDSWGNKVVADGATDPWGYEAQYGYYSDTETGLILCTHRYYDPAQGRWLNRDPIGYAGGVNLYGYAGNNSATRRDSNGYIAGVDDAAIIVVVVAVEAAPIIEAEGSEIITEVEPALLQSEDWWMNVGAPWLQNASSRILNVCSGAKPQAGAINVDLGLDPKVFPNGVTSQSVLPGSTFVISDLLQSPWPFPTGFFNQINGNLVLPNVFQDPIFQTQACRVLAPGNTSSVLVSNMGLGKIIGGG